MSLRHPVSHVGLFHTRDFSELIFGSSILRAVRMGMIMRIFDNACKSSYVGFFLTKDTCIGIYGQFSLARGAKHTHAHS